RENIREKEEANQTHYGVGAKVRQTIKDIGGTMPENLSVAEDIKKVSRRIKRGIKSATKEIR
ncbi:MAG: DNA damage-inducible protein D, partial [bacterium]